jgi:molybdopterin synthase catalytic subunit
MTIQVLLFGACREAAGTGEIAIDLESPATVGDAFARISEIFPGLEPFLKSALFAVNEEHVRAEHEVCDGDTLAIFPPVSGGSDDGDIFEITRDPIDKLSLEQRLITGAAGAVVTFDGIVRNQTKGRQVLTLQYEAYVPMALKEMRRIGAEIHEKWPDVLRVGMIHRFGELGISESSVAITITSAHRRVAFDACRYAIDRLKQTVPIWKKEVFADGEAWVEGERPSEI